MVCSRIAMDETRNSMGTNRIANVPQFRGKSLLLCEFSTRNSNTMRNNLQDELFAPLSGRKIFQFIHSIIWLALSVTYSKEIK
jgi:hypothetical protein